MSPARCLPLHSEFDLLSLGSMELRIPPQLRLIGVVVESSGEEGLMRD